MENSMQFESKTGFVVVVFNTVKFSVMKILSSDENCHTLQSQG